jgi:hypothetical protein
MNTAPPPSLASSPLAIDRSRSHGECLQAVGHGRCERGEDFALDYTSHHLGRLPSPTASRHSPRKAGGTAAHPFSNAEASLALPATYRQSRTHSNHVLPSAIAS